MAVDRTRYINTETWEIEECPTNYIPCDQEIAYVILLLNKKGYKTFSSCAGHDKVVFSEGYYSIDMLEERKNSPFYRITKINPKNFHALSESKITVTYINFIDGADYHFDTLPEGFTIKKPRFANRIAISKTIELYDSDDQRKSHEEVEKELQVGWKALIKWAKELKENKL